MINLEKNKLSGWSCASSTICSIFVAKNKVDLRKIISYSKKNDLTICTKGSGNSYGDEFQNENNIVVDTSTMNKILSWHPESGIMIVEPGVSLQKTLKVTLPDNWVLPVVPGTRFPTIGGCVSNNVHGKNSYKVGNFGDYVREFDIILFSGEIVNCSREKNSELFYSAIGGMGMLGIFTRISLQLKKVESTNLCVKKCTVPNLGGMIEFITNSTANCDYVIGQIDCFQKGNKIGRGTIHTAVHAPNNLLKNSYTDDLEIPERFFSVVPANWALELGKIFISSFSMRLISNLKYYVDFFNSKKNGHFQSFPKFNFLLDRIPDWPKVFKHGFYEFEPLIPAEKANKVIEEILIISQQSKMIPYICGIKLHRKDDFLLSYSLNGFSVGFDYPRIPQKIEKQKEIFFKLHEIVADSGGIVYLAKDNLVTPEHFKKMYNIRIDEFLRIKKQYDPNMLFQSNMFRRLFLN